MLHSIIIPHRGRYALLQACLESIHYASQLGDPAEVIVVNADPRPFHTGAWPFVRVYHYHEPMPVFNKAALLNLGMSHALGHVLTFLDCDAIVAPRFLEGVQQHLREGAHHEPPLTRLCYRVRHLPAGSEHFLRMGLPPMAAKRYWLDSFDNYARHPRAYEAYITPRFSPAPGKEPIGQPIFGNSQFSIRRDTLEALAKVSPGQPTVEGAGGRQLLAWDEAYAGHGFEDLDYIHRIWHAAKRTPHGYHAHILTDPDHALLHIRHTYEHDWRPRETRKGIIHEPLREANLARFRSKHS